MELRRLIEFKLPKLPNHTPTEITIVIVPELAGALQQYADVYADAYGAVEAVDDLNPYMLSAFIESDRGFARIAKDGMRTRSVEVPTPSQAQFFTVKEFAREARTSRRTIDRYRRDRPAGFPKEYDVSRGRVPGQGSRSAMCSGGSKRALSGDLTLFSARPAHTEILLPGEATDLLANPRIHHPRGVAECRRLRA